MRSKKNELPVLLGSLVITLGILAAGYWWLTRSNPLQNWLPRGQSSSPVRSFLSQGTKGLAASEGSTQAAFLQAKQAGMAALAQGKAAEAVAQFASALQIHPNAPETRIYFNNARIGADAAYTIAIVTPLQSDLNGSLELLRGVAQAQTEVNQVGGIKGTPLKVLIADDGGNVETAQQVARALVDDAAVLGVIGHYASDVTLATGAIYNQAGLVTISPISTSVKLSNFSPYVFRTVPSDYVAARALADYALKRLQRQRALVFFNSQSGYSQSLKSEFSTAMALGGGTVVQEVDLSAPDFSAAQSLSAAVEADLILLAANTGMLDRALQVVQANQQKRPILGGDDVYSPKTLEVGGTAAVGMVVAVPWHIDADPIASFPKSARQFWRAEVNWRTALAYDATQAFVAALQQQASRDGVKTALSSPSFRAMGASGPVRFLPSGDRNAGIQLVQVVTGKKSGFGFDFVPIARN